MDDIENMREKFKKNYGASDAQAETLFPTPGRLKNRPFAFNRKDYEQDVTTMEKDSMMYNKLILALKDRFADDIASKKMKGTEDALLATDEGRQGMEQLKAMQAGGESPQEIAAVEKPAGRKRLARL